MTNQLELDGLEVGFAGRDGIVPVVRGVSLGIGRGEIVGLVGESGCGKSVTCMAAMGLLGQTAAFGGAMRWKGNEIDPTDDAAMSRLRGREMSMIFQDPMSSLNPVQTVGRQLVEAIRIASDGRMSRGEAGRRAIELLSDVGVPDPAQRLAAYPHQLSGGLSQRVMIAMMLAGDPELLIADEPTTALDVTVQAQIMDLLRSLRDRRQMSIILVTHDLGVVAQTCDRVVVMYCGRVIETGPVADVFAAPRHPYTNGLIASLPRLDRDADALNPVPGVVPQPQDFGAGCDFAPRCASARPACSEGCPALTDASHAFACFHPTPEEVAT